MLDLVDEVTEFIADRVGGKVTASMRTASVPQHQKSHPQRYAEETVCRLSYCTQELIAGVYQETAGQTSCRSVV